MWIKEPVEPLSDSGSENVNFLFSQDKFYIMDNHVAASWCWLQKINVQSSYNLFHIDKHYDLLDFPHSVKSEILDKNIKLNELSFEEYLSLRQPMSGNDTAQLFRFDNYIGNLHHCYPSLFKEGYFATHEDGNVMDGLISYEPRIYDLESNITYWIKKNSRHKWIFNLDIDYFFNADHHGGLYQFLSDEYVLNICKELESCLKRIEVVTIALSPQFCGGWDKSLNVVKIITEYFDLDFDLQDLVKA